jgi:hypothetical protein
MPHPESLVVLIFPIVATTNSLRGLTKRAKGCGHGIFQIGEVKRDVEVARVER